MKDTSKLSNPYLFSILAFSIMACSSEGTDVETSASGLVEDYVEEGVGMSESSSATEDVIEDEEPGMLCDADRIMKIAERVLEKREGQGEVEGSPDRKVKKRPRKVRRHPVKRALVRVLFSYDENGDGVDEQELEAAVSDISACCEARLALLLEEFDVDGDGSLDADERKAMREGRREGRRERRQTRYDEIAAQYDEDGNGLDRDELRAARTDRFESIGVDITDGVDETEKAVFRAEVRERFASFCAAEDK